MNREHPIEPRDPAAGEGQEAVAAALRISFRILRLTLLAMLLIYLFSGVFAVRQHERAFVLLTGRITGIGEQRVRGPGLHWTLPRPFSEIVRLPAERVRSLESDSFWYYVSDEDRLRGVETPPGERLDPQRDGYALSGDANLFHSRWIVRYTIEDPERYAFSFSDPEQLLRNELDHAVVSRSARFGIDQVLRTDIEAFRSEVEQSLRGRIAAMGLGARLQRIDLVSVRPPRQVEAAFDAVIETEQERSQRISEARARASRRLNEARGDAARLVSEGEAYRQRLVSEARANADYFEQIYDHYTAAPRITAQTLLQDTLRRVLEGVDDKYVVSRNPEGKREMRLLLSPRGRRPPSLQDRQ